MLRASWQSNHEFEQLKILGGEMAASDNTPFTN